MKILSLRQNFVAATCCTKSNWFNFVRNVAATKFCRGDKILIDLPPNVEVFTPGDLSLQPIAAMSAYDSLVPRRSDCFLLREIHATVFRATKSNQSAWGRGCAYDVSLYCTHKAMCCINVLQRFVASCVPILSACTLIQFDTTPA